MKSVMVFFIMIISLVYLFNPGAGFLDFIPDNFPIVGNLDEAGATALFLACLRYFGLDITKIFKRKKDGEQVKDIN